VKLLGTLISLAPFLFRGSSQKSVSRIAKALVTGLLGMLGLIFIAVATFRVLLEAYGATIACFVMGLLCMSLALILRLLPDKSKKRALQSRHGAKPSDPFSSALPSSLIDDETIEQLQSHIIENPLATTSTAFAVGLTLSSCVIK
jgi:uncharacterized membrane protein YdcZ (DUF606 family)